MLKTSNRNFEIVRLYRNGVPVPEIARRYNLSCSRVYRIIGDPVSRRASYYPRLDSDGTVLLKKLRVAKGYSRKKLAEETQLSEVTIWLIENQQKPVKKSTARAIANILGYSLETLFDVKGVDPLDTPGYRAEEPGGGAPPVCPGRS